MGEPDLAGALGVEVVERAPDPAQTPPSPASPLGTSGPFAGSLRKPKSPAILRAAWTGARVAEGAGLENRYTGNGIVGSNPTLSVNREAKRLGG